MEKQISDKMDWFEVETLEGTWFAPFYLASGAPIGKEEYLNQGDLNFEEVKKLVSDFIEPDSDSICYITRTNGFGARLSMPGYLDCTEWTVFETKEKASEYLEECYGD